MSVKRLMIVNSETGEQEEILGKYMYYSFPKLIVKAEKVKDICEIGRASCRERVLAMV